MEHKESPVPMVGPADAFPSSADVLVAGAGPTGLALSLRLAQEGHSVVLVERWAAPYSLPRAVGLGHESRRLMNGLVGMEQLEPLLDLSPAGAAVEFLTREGEVLLGVPFQERCDSGWPELTPFNQPDFEALLTDLVEKSESIQLLRGVMVTGLQDRGDSVEVLLQGTDEMAMARPAAPVQHVTAKLVVGADGAQSTVRSLTDLPLDEDLRFSSDWVVIDVEPTDDEPWFPYAGQILAPPRPTTSAPAGPGRRRFEFMLLPGETKEAMGSETKAWELLSQQGVTPARARLVRHVAYTFNARWATQWRRGRIVLAGDAAHQMPPFLAQGLNSSLRDVAALSWRLNLFLRGLAPIDTLDHYARERAAHVGTIIRETVGMGAMLCEIDPEACAQRDAMLRGARDAGAGLPPRDPWRIDTSSLAPGDPYAGLLGRQGLVRTQEGEGWFDDLIGANAFVLISRNGAAKEHLSPETLNRWNELGGLCVDFSPTSPVADAEGFYDAWFTEWDCDVILVRPDFYVFGTAPSAAGADKLVAQLISTLN